MQIKNIEKDDSLRVDDHEYGPPSSCGRAEGVRSGARVTECSHDPTLLEQPPLPTVRDAALSDEEWLDSLALDLPPKLPFLRDATTEALAWIMERTIDLSAERLDRLLKDAAKRFDTLSSLHAWYEAHWPSQTGSPRSQ